VLKTAGLNATELIGYWQNLGSYQERVERTKLLFKVVELSADCGVYIADAWLILFSDI
jgi:hypothetical protein